eukprot:SAG22_NODE_121_length_19129_cov_36.644614_9_plen_59_part_00
MDSGQDDNRVAVRWNSSRRFRARNQSIPRGSGKVSARRVRIRKRVSPGALGGAQGGGG